MSEVTEAPGVESEILCRAMVDESRQPRVSAHADDAIMNPHNGPRRSQGDLQAETAYLAAVEALAAHALR